MYPVCTLAGPNMSALQDSLYGTDYGVALLSPEVTALHHTRSPRCSGSLLRGSLAITTTGLAPVSHQDLSRRTIWMLEAALSIRVFHRLCLFNARRQHNRAIREQFVAPFTIRTSDCRTYRASLGHERVRKGPRRVRICQPLTEAHGRQIRVGHLIDESLNCPGRRRRPRVRRNPES
jgi:hypothetical protein